MSLDNLKDANSIFLCFSNSDDAHMLRGLLIGNDYKVQVYSSFYALSNQVKRQSPHLIIFDNVLTLQNVVELCRLRSSALYCNSMQLMGLVELMNYERENALFNSGIDNVIHTPISSGQVLRLVRAAVERSKYLEDRDNFEKLLFTLTSACDAREVNSEGHSERVASMARRLGQRVGMSEEEQRTLYQGGMLHDIGMIKISRKILDKTGVLDSEEYDTIKTHTVWGERLCRSVRSLEKTLPLIRHHHEQMDGSGYPDGLKGDEIPELARVVAICEVYDALSSDRPYRPRLSPENVIRYLREHAERNWLDKNLVIDFIKIIEEDSQG